jgi:integrase
MDMPKLTERFISGFKPEGGAKDRLAFDTETRGLGVRATVSGTRTFICQWTDRATGRKVREPLGAWGSITLDQARTAAKAILGKVAQGVNPSEARAAAKAAEVRRRAAEATAAADAKFTFETLISEWAGRHLVSKRPRYAAEAQRALRWAFAKHLHLPASEIDHALILGAVDDLVTAGKSPIAGRTVAYGRAAYGWAIKRRKLSANPFAGLPEVAGSAPTRERVLTDAELAAIWRAAAATKGPFAPLVQLLMLTLGRRDEVAGLRWTEISPDLAIWTLPAARSKNAKAHIIHLSPLAQAILRSIPRIEGQDFVFSVTGTTAVSGFSKAKSAIDTASKVTSWRFHDFRRTGVTWLAGAGFPPHVADRLLNHVGGSITGVARVYQRNEFLSERKAALDAWSTHVERCADGVDFVENIVSLRAAGGAP